MVKITVHYEYDDQYKNYNFSENEKRILRPIAETLAMIDGNAFFTLESSDGEWYEQYLPEAMSIFKSNGGLEGWASEASWIKDIAHETPEVAEAYENYRILKSLSRSK